jgi:hypothetical protein
MQEDEMISDREQLLIDIATNDIVVAEVTENDVHRYAEVVVGIAEAHGIDNAANRTIESNAFALSMVTLIALALEAIEARNK